MGVTVCAPKSLIAHIVHSMDDQANTMDLIDSLKVLHAIVRSVKYKRSFAPYILLCLNVCTGPFSRCSHPAGDCRVDGLCEAIE